jgi:hypothetical protein
MSKVTCDLSISVDGFAGGSGLVMGRTMVDPGGGDFGRDLHGLVGPRECGGEAGKARRW